ncbi:hypothetical protein TNCV_1281501 [Trichonephila clavipes]|nr:hypothetical protein TNCV_1281501 [Trichonephila clavipes]
MTAPVAPLPSSEFHTIQFFIMSTDSIEKKNSDERPPKKSEDSSNEAHSSSNPHKSKYIPTIEDLIVPQESDKDFKKSLN